MKGLLCSEKQRLRFHLLDVNDCLVDLNRTFRPNLAIIEGLIGLEGIDLTPLWMSSIIVVVGLGVMETPQGKSQ